MNKKFMEDIRQAFKALVLELIEVPNEDRETEILYRLDSISPDPEYIDYIFHSDEFFNCNNQLDMEALIQKVFNYKPINL